MNQEPLYYIMESFDRLGILPHTKPNAIGMWPNEQECLVWTALQCDPKPWWVEVGSFCGGSTILLGMAKEAIDVLDKALPLLAVDLNFNPLFDYNIKRSKLTNITKIEGDSIEALSQVDQPISFLFLDGWHSFSSVVREFKTALPNLDDNAIIGFHDVSPKMLTHDPQHIDQCYEYSQLIWNELIEDRTQDFRLDEAVAYICVEYGYEIIDIPVRKPISHFKETGLTEWVRGTTSPHNSFTAIRKTK